MPKFAMFKSMEWDKSQSRLLCMFLCYTTNTIANVGKLLISAKYYQVNYLVINIYLLAMVISWCIFIVIHIL